MIAEVIINSSATELNRTFDYNIPENEHVEIGMRVIVPFGFRKKNEIGYVIGLKEKSEYDCKEIIKVADKVFDEKRLELAKWMANRYFCNLSDVIRLLVPPGTSTNLNAVNIKTEKWASLSDIEIEIDTIKSDKQKRIIQFLLDNVNVPVSELLVFTDTTNAVLNTLIKNKYVIVEKNEIQRNPFINKKIKNTTALKLTNEQENAYNKVILNEFKVYLLYGITGSGKTEIYLQLIDKIIKDGKTAIVLVPEISLTPQITDRFISRFGDIVAILHSRLSIGERYDEWRRIKENKAKIVIGARSAIFAPLENIGIIIIDEEHDSSYKSETTPKYDVRNIAEKIANTNNIPLILGSATPDIRTYYKAQKGEINLLKLENRISSSGIPDVDIVDLREEIASGNKTVFSRKLYNEINKNINNKEQTMLFLNRRGYYTFVMCRDCGYVVKCDSCDVAMTYHLNLNKLICHYCGKTHENINICPSCGGQNIRYFGTGTQKIEAEIHKYFPNATVLRMDIDTTGTKNAHEKILNKFIDDKVDILLGTQMITKGHDFSNVTLVGILAADTSINIGDYRANERTFQLLTQAAGRAGRGEKKGRAIIQTYMPDEYSIIAAKEQNYEKFYKYEINIREKLNYPPFCDIIMCVLMGENEDVVKTEINKAFDILKDKFNAYSPAPAPISRINGEYRWRILIKTNIDDEKISLINECLKEYNNNKDSTVRFILDINPINML
jgi:primosomal protein N' (replication factor Y)